MESDRGFALAAALIVLALLTVLGAAALQSTTLEVQISARDRDARAALYVAESALEEARYYAARGWGKISWSGAWVAGSVADVEVTTSSDLPFTTILPWSANLYTGFTLRDRAGERFLVTGNTDTLPYRITIDSWPNKEPAVGRFVLVREIPSPWVTPPETVSASGNDLTVQSTAWANASGTDTWVGWTLWDRDDQAFAVVASTSDSGAGTVTLTVPSGQSPGPGPYALTINPWLAALASGVPLAGDADGDPARWNRSFDDGTNPLGAAAVSAQRPAPGRYELTSVGGTGGASRRVSLVVHRAGRPDQRVADWKVGGGM